MTSYYFAHSIFGRQSDYIDYIFTFVWRPWKQSKGGWTTPQNQLQKQLLWPPHNWDWERWQSLKECCIFDHLRSLLVVYHLVFATWYLLFSNLLVFLLCELNQHRHNLVCKHQSLEYRFDTIERSNNENQSWSLCAIAHIRSYIWGLTIAQ